MPTARSVRFIGSAFNHVAPCLVKRAVRVTGAAETAAALGCDVVASLIFAGFEWHQRWLLRLGTPRRRQQLHQELLHYRGLARVHILALLPP
jgi:hypothetical protein